MTVSLRDEIVYLDGPCRVEDAEILFNLLQAGPERKVDLTAAGHPHAAVVQVLLATRPMLVGPAPDPFVNMWIMPVLAGIPEPADGT